MVGDRQDGAATAAPSYKKLGKITSTKVGSIYPTLTFDTGWKDLAAAFMAIKKTITPSGLQVTYKASRSEEASHGDLAWACMHALANEPLEGATSTNTGFMELF